MKSYANMKKTPDLDLVTLNVIFNTKYKYLSKAEEIINRCLKDLESTDLNVTYEKNKKNKTMKFFIEKNKNREKKKEAISINKKNNIVIEEDNEIMNGIYKTLNMD